MSRERTFEVAIPAPGVDGTVYRRIWDLAWPVSISMSTSTLLTLVNLFWIGRFGTAAVAAVSVCGNILFIIFGLSNVVYAGSLAIVARRVGEGNLRAAGVAALHGVCLAAMLGLFVALAGYAAAPGVIGFFETGADVAGVALSYLRLMLFGQVFLFVVVALSASYQATGDARTPMLVNVVVVLLNGLLDPFFIFAPGALHVGGFDLGWLGWGVDGAAIAAVLSGAVGCALFLGIAAATGKPFPRPSRGEWMLEPRHFWHMLRIGAPAGVSMIARPLSTFLLLKVIASFGTAAIAAFGIALRSFSVNWIPYAGLNTAVSTLVGQSLGARNLPRAERVVRRGLGISAVLGVAFCALYYGFAREIILAFDREPAVVAAGAPFLQLIALSFLFSAPMYPLVSAMNGAGDTKPPMVTAFLANWLVKLPLCWALAIPFGYGVDGVWIGMFASIVFEALAMFAWYWRGTWKTRQV